MPKTWAQKLAASKAPHVVTLEKPFAGIPKGARLFIASPLYLDKILRTIPPGSLVELPELRARLAKDNSADATCPVTTSIFLRVVAEAALEQLATGAESTTIAPFWRVIAPASPIAKKLSCDSGFITMMRSGEF